MDVKYELEEPIEVTVDRARKLWLMVVAGVIWSLFYTATSLYMMNGLSNRLQESCESRQAARTAIREVLLDAPFLSESEQYDLDVNLPAKVDC